VHRFFEPLLRRAGEVGVVLHLADLGGAGGGDRAEELRWNLGEGCRL